MATLFGKSYTRAQLLERVGDPSQIAGVIPVELQNGNERGNRTLLFRTGSGLAFSVLCDRGMDIFSADFNGASLAWHSPTGPASPAFYEPAGDGWLRTFAGGLVTTCGLTNVGPDNTDEGEELGFHGRISHVPAKNVAYGAEWQDDDFFIWATADIRETSVFGDNLLLKRSIHTRLGESRIWVKDEIENQGFQDSPLMLLYHCNLGFPVVDQDSELIGVLDNLQPRDRTSASGQDTFDRFIDPQTGFEEQVFFIEYDADKSGMVNTAVVNRQFNNNMGLGVYVSYPKIELPYFTEWKMMSKGAYVVGLEPGNCIPEGRHSARKRGTLKTLKPGETYTARLEFGVLANNNDIRAFEARLHGLNDE